MASDNNLYYIDKSTIHGEGIFTNTDFNKNKPIDVGIDFELGLIPYVTPSFGSLINHSYQPNAYLKWKDKKWYVVASRNIKKGEEITLNYNNTPWYIKGPEPHYK